MNIIDAFLSQKGGLVIVFSSFYIDMIKEIVKNLSKDLRASFIDITEETNVEEIESIDKEKINEIFKKNKEAVKFVVATCFPNNTFNLRVNYHINLSLNKVEMKEKQVEKKLINLSYKLTDKVRINKYVNYKNFDNQSKIEDEIFNIVIKYIESKLDNGKYLDRVSSQSDSSIVSDSSISSDSNNTSNSDSTNKVDENNTFNSTPETSDTNSLSDSESSINVSDIETQTEDNSEKKTSIIDISNTDIKTEDVSTESETIQNNSIGGTKKPFNKGVRNLKYKLDGYAVNKRLRTINLPKFIIGNRLLRKKL